MDSFDARVLGYSDAGKGTATVGTVLEGDGVVALRCWLCKHAVCPTWLEISQFADGRKMWDICENCGGVIVWRDILGECRQERFSRLNVAYVNHIECSRHTQEAFQLRTFPSIREFNICYKFHTTKAPASFLNDHRMHALLISLLQPPLNPHISAFSVGDLVSLLSPVSSSELFQAQPTSRKIIRPINPDIL